jgi:hypothetical protein
VNITIDRLPIVADDLTGEVVADDLTGAADRRDSLTQRSRR